MVVNLFSKFKLRVLFIIITMGLVLSLFQDPIFVSASDSNREPIRVGYYENEVFQEGASEDAIKTGYAYEYYRKLSQYTGWEYEYVYGTYNELYNQLINGDIDFLAGLAYKEDRADIIGYPDAAMGVETYNLLKHANDSTITTDPDSLNEHTIGVLNSAMVSALETYMQGNDIDATVVIYDEFDALSTAFDNNEIDIIAVEGNGTSGRRNAEVVLPFGITNYYVCVNKRKPELLKELNEAQNQLFMDEPYYLSTLSAKYYASTVSARSFSDIEREWLDSHNNINVGYLNNYLPYSDTTSSGNTTGIVKDVMPVLFESLGLKDITFSYVGYDNYEDMIAAVDSEEIDVAFPVGGGNYFSENSGIYQSNAVVTSSTDLIYKYVVVYPNQATFAVNSNNSMQYYYIKSNYPDATIIYYDSIEECLNAVIRGEVDCTTLNGFRANDILKNTDYMSLSVRQLADNDDRCLGIKIGNEGLLRLINRGINIMGTDYIENMAYKYTDGLYTYNAYDWFRDRAYIFMGILLIMVIIAVIIVYRRDKLNRTIIKSLNDVNNINKSFIDSVVNNIREPLNRDIELTLASHGKLFLQENSFDLIQVIGELESSVHGKVAEKKLTVTLDTKEIVNRQIINDEARFKIVLGNILTDVVEHVPNNTHINLSAKEILGANPKMDTYTFTLSMPDYTIDNDVQNRILDEYNMRIVELMGGSIFIQASNDLNTNVVINTYCKIDYGKSN